MGSWSVYCGVSNISITAGNDCVLLPLKENRSSNGYLPYIPATLPIFGRYDDYGGLEDIVEDDNTKLIESHFGVSIHNFCQYFSRGCITQDEEDFPIDLKEVEEIKKWKFMFIDRQVYNFMSTHNQDLYGDHDFGKPEFLKLLGAKYLGKFPKKDARYKHFWDLNGLEIKSDNTWAHYVKSNRGIYSGESTELIKVLSDENINILKQTKESLWRIYDKKYIAENYYWIIGVDSHIYSMMDLMTGMSEQEIKKFSKRMGMSTNTGIAEKYISKFDVFGDSITQLIRIRHNMHNFSQYFNPYVLYLTPQCGEHEAHQTILEKFSEINKSYSENC